MPAVVECGKGDEGELAVRRDEKPMCLAQLRHEWADDEIVEFAGRWSKGGVATGEYVMQALRSLVDGCGGAKIEHVGPPVSEEKEREIARLARALRRSVGIRNERTVGSGRKRNGSQTASVSPRSIRIAALSVITVPSSSTSVGTCTSRLARFSFSRPGVGTQLAASTS